MKHQGRIVGIRVPGAVAGVFLTGCVMLVAVGCSGTPPETPKEGQGHAEATKEQGHDGVAREQTRPREAGFERGRCEDTRTLDLGTGFGGDAAALTNDVPGCPDGGVLEGTSEADKLTGEGGEDEVRGFGGADEMWGGFGGDIMYGGPGDDFLTGGTVNEAGHDKSKDVLYGGPGRDSVNGFGGDDVLYGGDGDDVNRVYGGKGEDVLYGGDGNDFVDASADGQRDMLYCGEGRDEYAADEIDRVSGSCEKKVTMSSM